MNSKVLFLHTFLVLLSYTLGRFVNPAWLWLSALVGVNFIQSAFTGFCPVEKLLGGPKRLKDVEEEDE